MEPPRIQYAKTTDGVSIAYYTRGQGPPIVWIELPSQLQLEEKLFPTQERTCMAMSRVSTLVRYDHRGFGLSDRTVTNFPLDDLVKDLEAIVDKLGFDSFVLLAAGGFTCPVAIAYTVAHPDRVSRLVIGGPFSRVQPAFYQRIQALMVPGSDWRFVSEAISRLIAGWDDEEITRPLAAWFRESSSFETFKAFWRDLENWDVRQLLPTIDFPTLITAFPENPMAGVEQAREMASLVPNAQLILAEGVTFEERNRTYETAVASFLYGPAAARRPAAAQAAPSGTAIILFADIVDSTALTERLGDDAFRDKARGLDEAMRAAIRANRGTAVEGKTLGDGVLAIFSSARQAIACAQACHDAATAADLSLHVGIHAGDVIREADNVYGGAVNIAARVAAASEPGETLVSGTVRELARTSAGVSFEDRGEQAMKGIAEPQRLFAVVPSAG